jgi:hypothetical protein
MHASSNVIYCSGSYHHVEDIIKRRVIAWWRAHQHYREKIVFFCEPPETKQSSIWCMMIQVDTITNLQGVPYEIQ